MRISEAVKLVIIFLILNCLTLFSVNCQETDSLRLFSNRRIISGITASIIYPATMTALYKLWYKENMHSSFQFFNDSDEWLIQDKIGHSAASYTIGKVGYKTMKWCGYSDKKSVWIGGVSGFLFLTSIEIFDGFSKDYGFSLPDIAANSLGSGFFISQQLLWKEQRISIKFSFHETKYAQYRPNLLGMNHLERIIKDYNGQTYWWSVNIKSFLKRSSCFPAWLNIACGYGAKGMTGAAENMAVYNGKPIPYFKRSPYFYLSPDIDLSRIPTHSKTLKLIFDALGNLKFPLPAIEYSRNSGVIIKGCYF